MKREYGTNPMSECRHDANEEVDKAKRRRQIKSILKNKKCGLTAKETAVIMHRKGLIPTDERNFTAPRLTELCEMGEVEPIGKAKCEYTGRTVTVYKLRVSE